MKQAILRLLGLSEVKEAAVACKEHSLQAAEAVDLELDAAFHQLKEHTLRLEEQALKTNGRSKNGRKAYC